MAVPLRVDLSLVLQLLVQYIFSTSSKLRVRLSSKAPAISPMDCGSLRVFDSKFMILQLIVVPAELLRACHIFLAMCLDLSQHAIETPMPSSGC